MKRTYNGEFYEAIPPQPDNEVLAARGGRLMFRHGSPTDSELKTFRAPKDILTAGWVIGLFDV